MVPGIVRVVLSLVVVVREAECLVPGEDLDVGVISAEGLPFALGGVLAFAARAQLDYLLGTLLVQARDSTLEEGGTGHGRHSAV